MQMQTNLHACRMAYNAKQGVTKPTVVLNTARPSSILRHNSGLPRIMLKQESGPDHSVKFGQRQLQKTTTNWYQGRYPLSGRH